MLWYRRHQLKSNDESQAAGMRSGNLVRRGTSARSTQSQPLSLTVHSLLGPRQQGRLGDSGSAGTIKPLEAALGDEYGIVREAAGART